MPTEVLAKAAEESAGKPTHRAKRRWLVPFSQLENAMKRLDIGPTEMGEAVGCDGSSISNWRREGQCPQAIALAAEALVRRQAPGRQDLGRWLLTLNSHGQATCQSVEGAKEILMDEQLYWLVPQPRSAAR